MELVPEVGSTNAVLLERARAGAPHGVVLVADHQTDGRGRLDRRWESAPGAALLVSVLLRPDVPVQQAFRTTWAAGLAACDAVAALGAAGVALKWPNDVIVGERKLAGILAEAVVAGGSLDAVVVGMGLNLRRTGVPPGAVALDELLGRDVGRDEVLERWLAAFDGWLGRDLEALHGSYRARCATIGSAVEVQRAGGSVRGVVADVRADGRLELTSGDVFDVGDVVHIRTG